MNDIFLPNIKLQRRYSLALTRYCEGGCDYCCQVIKEKSCKDTEDELLSVLNKLQIFIENIKKSYEKLNKYYELSCSLMGGELTDAPQWFQDKLIPLIQELSNYMKIVFFTRGGRVKDNKLIRCINELSKEGKASFVIHLVHWMNHPYAYWIRYYNNYIEKGAYTFTIVMRPEELPEMVQWGNAIKNSSDNVPLFVNQQITPDGISTELYTIFSNIIQKTQPLGCGENIHDVPFELRKRLCHYISQHGGGTVNTIDVTCDIDYLCCGQPRGELLPKRFLNHTPEDRLNPELHTFDSDFSIEICKNCKNMNHITILGDLKYQEKSVDRLLDTFLGIESTDWKNN